MKRTYSEVVDPVLIQSPIPVTEGGPRAVTMPPRIVPVDAVTAQPPPMPTLEDSVRHPCALIRNLGKELVELAERSETKIYSVAVVGDRGVGKSAWLNSLLTEGKSCDFPLPSHASAQGVTQCMITVRYMPGTFVCTCRDAPAVPVTHLFMAATMEEVPGAMEAAFKAAKGKGLNNLTLCGPFPGLASATRLLLVDMPGWCESNVPAADMVVNLMDSDGVVLVTKSRAILDQARRLLAYGVGPGRRTVPLLYLNVCRDAPADPQVRDLLGFGTARARPLLSRLMQRYQEDVDQGIKNLATLHQAALLLPEPRRDVTAEDMARYQAVLRKEFIKKLSIVDWRPVASLLKVSPSGTDLYEAVAGAGASEFAFQEALLHMYFCLVRHFTLTFGDMMEKICNTLQMRMPLFWSDLWRPVGRSFFALEAVKPDPPSLPTRCWDEQFLALQQRLLPFKVEMLHKSVDLFDQCMEFISLVHRGVF